MTLLWVRDEDFFRNYHGKLCVFGHTREPSTCPRSSAATRPKIQPTFGPESTAWASTQGPAAADS